MVKMAVGAGTDSNANPGLKKRSKPAAGVAPAMLAAPALSGPGLVGAVLRADPGVWGGVPAPVVTPRWRRNGVDMPGATALDYVPGAADDGAELRCAVKATNASGTASAVTEAVRIAYPAPVVSGAPADRVLDQGPGTWTLDATSAFAGAALTFGVSGAEATADPATGLVSIPLGTPRAAETVTVTATNSGGSASVSFAVTVTAAPVLTAPASLVAPSLSGAGRVGAPMRVETGTWSGDPTPVLSVRWTRNGADIPGAAGADYVPVAADEGTELRGVVTATNAAGSVTVATAPAFIATPGTLRTQVEALVTSAGRTSTAALKTPGVDALPSGVTLSGKTITLSGAGATLENWNLTGLLVQMNGADQTVRQCVLGEADGVAGILYYVQTGPDATNPTVENCDLFGFEGVGGSGAFVNQQSSGGEVTPNVARGLTLRLNHFRHASGDYIKVHGADFRIERNFFDVVSCYPPGTPTWNGSIVFAVGDPCLNASGFLFLARQAGTLPEPPSRKTDDAFWDSQDPHTDLITVRGAVGDGDHLILNNYFISQVGARSPGLTQQIRYVRNTGTPTPSGRVRITGNVFEEWGGFYPFAAGGIRDHVTGKSYDAGEYCSASGLRYRSLRDGNAGNAPASSPAWWEQVYDMAFEGPVVFQHNWLGKGSNGVYYANGAMSDTLTLWGDNLDHLTDAPVTGPEYATVTTTPQPAFGSAGPAPSLAEYGPFTAFDITPLTYGRIQVGGLPVNACVVAVHGQVAVYFPQGGSPVVLSGRGFTLSEQGGGTWRLSTPNGAVGVKAVVSAGSATVTGAGALPETVVFGIMGMSTMEYMLNPGGPYGQIDYPSGIPSTPNVTAWTDSTSSGPGVIVKREVTAARVAAGDINPVIANWSVFWHRMAPGVHFHVVDLAVPGTDRQSLMNSNNSDVRWPAFTAMLAAVRAEGLEFDAIIDNWGGGGGAQTMRTFGPEWSPFYMGQRWNGSPFTLGNVNPDSAFNASQVVDRCLWDITAPAGQKGRGVFIRDRTKLWFSGWNTMAGAPVSPAAELLNASTNLDGTAKSGDMTFLDSPARKRLDEFLADSRVATFAGHQIGGAHIAQMDYGSDYSGGNHPERDPSKMAKNSDGQILMSIGIGAAALKLAGVPVFDPTVNAVTVPSGGAYADVEVLLPNGGDLTTIRQLESRPALGGTLPPHYQPVMGFEIRRAGDDDDERRPVYRTNATSYPASHRGTVTIQSAGSGSPRRGIIRITPTVPFATGDRIEFGRGDASAMLVKPRDADAKLFLNMPLESVPAWRDMSATYPFPGVPVRPQPPALTIGAGVESGTGPANTVPPSISGLVAVGETLTVTDGTWTGDAPITYSRVWRRDGAAIPGATGTSYVADAADVGGTITVVVTAANSAASATAASAPVGPITGAERGGSDFFTVRPAGPYYVDPDNVPENTTRIEYEMRIRLGGTGTSTVTLAGQESTGCDIQIGFPSGFWRCVVEDGDGTKMISGASGFSDVPPPGEWFKLVFDADFATNRARIIVNEVVVDTIPFISSASPASFQSNREISFFATSNGGNPVAGSGVGTVDCEYVQAHFTTGGTRTLRKRIDAANANSDAWKRGDDA
jgi:hypothetical protein